MLLFMLLYYDMHVNYIETIQRHSASLNNSNNSTIQQLGVYTLPQCMTAAAGQCDTGEWEGRLASCCRRLVGEHTSLQEGTQEPPAGCPHHLNIWLCIYSTAVGRLSTEVKQNTRKYMHNTLPTKELRPYQPEEILATSVPCMAVPKTRSACRQVESLPWLSSTKMVTAHKTE